MDVFADLWAAAKQGGPFVSMFLLAALYLINEERKTNQKKYDDLVGKFVRLAGDTSATLKDWRDMLYKVEEQ